MDENEVEESVRELDHRRQNFSQFVKSRVTEVSDYVEQCLNTRTRNHAELERLKREFEGLKWKNQNVQASMGVTKEFESEQLRILTDRMNRLPEEVSKAEKVANANLTKVETAKNAYTERANGKEEIQRLEGLVRLYETRLGLRISNTTRQTIKFVFTFLSEEQPDEESVLEIKYNKGGVYTLVEASPPLPEIPVLLEQLNSKQLGLPAVLGRCRRLFAAAMT